MISRLLLQLAIALAFLLLAQLSLGLGVAPFLSRPLWLPAALLAALVFARGSKDQWGLVLGAATFGYLRFRADGHALEAAMVNGAAMWVQVHVGNFLLARWLTTEGRELWRGRDLAVAGIVVGPIMMSVKPLMVVPVLMQLGLSQGSSAIELALDWLIIDCMAAFLVAPMILVWVGEPRAWWRSRYGTLVFGQAIVVVSFVFALHSSAVIGGDRVTTQIKAELAGRIERLLGQLEQLEEYGAPPPGGTGLLPLVPVRGGEEQSNPLIAPLPAVPGWALDLSRWAVHERASVSINEWQFLIGGEAPISVPGTVLLVSQRFAIDQRKFTVTLALPSLAVRALISKTFWWFQLTFSTAALLASLLMLTTSGRRRMLEMRVAERTDSLQKAMRSIDLFKALADQSTDPIIVIEPKAGAEASADASITQLAQLSYVNPAFEQVTQYRFDELIELASGCHQHQLGAELLGLLQQLGRGQPVKAEIAQQRKNGERYLAQINAFPIHADPRRISHWAAIYRDVSEERANERLSHERERHEQVGRVAGGIAHDFNNLLTVIQGGVELIRLDAEEIGIAEDLLDTIDQAISSGSELSQQLLAFSGRSKGRIERLELAARVRAMHKMLKMMVNPQTLFSIKIDAGEYWVLMDPAWVSQILVNLVINAGHALQDQAGAVQAQIKRIDQLSPPSLALDGVKAEQSKPVLCVLSEHARSGAHVCITVRDDGCGIPPEGIRQIFEPFYTTKLQGSGLGLAAVANVVRSAGGWLMVKSTTTQPGRGTEVSVYLPLAAERVPVVEPPRPVSTPTIVPGSTPAKSRGVALVVDDEPGVRTFITSVMKSQGWEVLCGVDGVEAQTLFQQHHVDVLISDLSMPRLGGFALLDWLVEQSHIPHIVLISGYCPERDAVMLRHGVHVKAWLDKPFTIKTLLEALPLNA